MTRRIRTLLSIAAAALLLGALAAWSDVTWDGLVETLGSLSPATFALAFAIHAAIYAARAERFRVLMAREARPDRGGLYAATSAHNLAVYVLPAKTGEATLPLYLKGACGTPIATSLASLVVSRLLDLATLAALGAVVTTIASRGPSWVAPRWTGIALAFALVAAAALCLSLCARGDRVLAFGATLLALTRLERTRVGVKFASGRERLSEALRQAGEPARLRAAAALSLAIWLGIFAFYVVLARGFGLPQRVDFAGAAFGSSFAVASNLLPVNALAGFGTQETGWVVGFGLVGVARDAALANGFGVHLVQLLDTALFGIAGHAAMAFAGRAGRAR